MYTFEINKLVPEMSRVLVGLIQENDEYVEVLKNIEKNYRRGLLCYKDVEKLVSQKLESATSAIAIGSEIIDNAVVLITQQILSGDYTE